MSGQTLGDLHCKPAPDILPSLSTCLSLGTLKHACIASAAQVELGRAGELHTVYEQKIPLRFGHTDRQLSSSPHFQSEKTGEGRLPASFEYGVMIRQLAVLKCHLLSRIVIVLLSSLSF